MNINDSVLSSGEKLIFALRELYLSNGYSPYRMSKFEEYDLYADNKDFLVSDNVITFTDIGGKLMALKPDVTLSIIKNSSDLPNETRKVFYNENVYRVSKSTGSFKEIMQSGVECFGLVGDKEIVQVTELAAKSLLLFSKDAESMATIVNDELSDVRSMAMSVAGDFEYVLHVDSSNPKGCYVQINKDGSMFRQYALKKGITVTATDNAGTSIIDGSGDIKFTFDKANGSIKQVNGASPTNGAIYQIHIVATINTSKTEDVYVVPATGRHYID